MWYNSIIKPLLRSPLHGIMSTSTMLITYTGRKSGKTYSTPVNYVRDGNDLLVVSYRHRTWWRNLRGGAPVTVLLQGKVFHGTGEAYTAADEVTAGLQAYLERAPGWSKYFQVSLDDTGQPDPRDVARAVQDRVTVRVQLAERTMVQ
jgi:deazaflavin-dependent oxidoreductase (nitroreductase family)